MRPKLKILAAVEAFIAEECGSSVADYSMIFAGAGVAVAITMFAMGDDLNSLLGGVNADLMER